MIQTRIIALVIALLSIVGVGAITYSHIYNKGKEEANQACAQARQQDAIEMKAKITKIEEALTQLASNNDKQTKALAKDINTILINIKKEPITIIKDGKCIPSPTFIDSINQAINRANSK